MKKAFTLAAIALGSTFALTGVAHAEPNGDPAKYADFTATFVSGLDPSALNAKAQGKNVIVSPYGVNHTIACRGNGADVPIYACMQEDDLGWITLQLVDVPGIGPAWTYFP
ncbi:hypothetical protein [Nocardia bovistercoris]|uniref:SH3 domain-containing protein n=1 Tax=Nocardia bovistercoris TaxID=2785916 RepID=A0A931IDC9_9NOCA|nr:hypothetical protein [Nocardia bovistercoris]MBH0778320.1 hypothetical protein [Nocardia bovistercoris]